MKWNAKNEADEFIEALFITQSSRYMVFTNYIVKWHLVEVILAALIGHRNIVCTENGTQWAYKNVVGSIIYFSYILGICLCAALMRAVFVKTIRPSPVWLFESRDLIDDKAWYANLIKTEK